MFTDVMSDQLAKSIRYVTPVPYRRATGLTAHIYQQLTTDFMPAPLVALHSPIPDLFASVWSILRESLLAGSANRSHKETVAATVSKTNECPFCVEAHTVMLRATSEHEVANAILQGDYDSIRDPEHHALVQWVLGHQTPFTPSNHPTPFSQADAPEMIGTVLTFQYINRMANVFMGDSLLPLPSIAKGPVYRLYAATSGKRTVRPLEAGHSLQFLPETPLTNDLSWAAGNASVAKAFAAFAKVVEATGETILPDDVRGLVTERIQSWNGEVMGMSRRWVDDAASQVDARHRAAVRLTLLSALASYQVDDAIIEDFRLSYPDDTQLIGAAAWASWATARRINAWLSAS